MYLWSTKKLEGELRDGTLSQSERFKYVLFLFTVTAIVIEIAGYISKLRSAQELVLSAFAVLITVFGTIWCYRVNRDGDNLEFLDRYICLSIPIGIRLVVLLAAVGLIYMILGYGLFGEAFDQFNQSTNWVDVFIGCGFQLIFYWRLSKAISNVAISGEAHP